MRAVNLYHRINFFAKTTSRDEYGATTDTWDYRNPTISTRGGIRYLGGTKVLENDEKFYEKRIELTVRYRSNITESMRVQIDSGSSLYAITFIEELGRKEGLRLTIQKYTEKEIYEIAKWYCKNKKIIATPSALKKIAGHGRNTPRIVFSLVDSCYSKSRFMAICASKISGEDKDSTTMITDEIVDMTFDDLNLHTYGIEKQEISILSSIRTHTNLSLYTICAITKVDQKQYLQFYEPHLLDLGFITKTSKGRSLTEKGKAFVDSISS